MTFLFDIYILHQIFWYVKHITNIFGNIFYMKEIRFPENLHSLRKSADMTQRHLAAVLDVDQRTISAWEKGVCEPSFAMLSKLCEIFGETFDDILT